MNIKLNATSTYLCHQVMLVWKPESVHTQVSPPLMRGLHTKKDLRSKIFLSLYKKAKVGISDTLLLSWMHLTFCVCVLLI